MLDLQNKLNMKDDRLKVAGSACLAERLAWLAAVAAAGCTSKKLSAGLVGCDKKKGER